MKSEEIIREIRFRDAEDFKQQISTLPTESLPGAACRLIRTPDGGPKCVGQCREGRRCQLLILEDYPVLVVRCECIETNPR